MIPAFLCFVFLNANPSLPNLNDEINYLKPNKTYKNDTRNAVYLILELPANKEFENQSEYEFRIVKQHEIDRFGFQKRLQGKIDMFESSMKTNERKLKALDERINGEKR